MAFDAQRGVERRECRSAHRERRVAARANRVRRDDLSARGFKVLVVGRCEQAHRHEATMRRAGAKVMTPGVTFPSRVGSLRVSRAHSSAVRASVLHTEGRWFDPSCAHTRLSRGNRQTGVPRTPARCGGAGPPALALRRRVVAFPAKDGPATCDQHLSYAALVPQGTNPRPYDRGLVAPYCLAHGARCLDDCVVIFSPLGSLHASECLLPTCFVEELARPERLRAARAHSLLRSRRSAA